MSHNGFRTKIEVIYTNKNVFWGKAGCGDVAFLYKNLQYL
jgi:hypothetical protein